MAGTWGTAAQASGVPVDDVPTVGSVAWWASYAAPAGEKGHVAYVEAVRPEGSILVSEDNLLGEFHWEEFGRSGTGWPSGFIHYPQSDGSPTGSFTSVASPSAEVIDFWGIGSDPDVYSATMSYLVTLGGPCDDPTAEQFWFATTYPQLAIAVRTGSPAGQVTVKDGSKVVATYALATSSHGVVTLKLPRQTVGTHSLTVAYGGSTSYYMSTSPAQTLRVR